MNVFILLLFKFMLCNRFGGLIIHVENGKWQFNINQIEKCDIYN